MSPTLASWRSLAAFQTQGQPAAVAGFGFALDRQAESLVKAQAEVLAAFELLA